MNAIKKITILGAGAWGSALACAMVRSGHDVVIWGRNIAVIDEINITDTNTRYLDDIKLEPKISATTDLRAAIKGANIILLVTPAQTVAKICSEIAAFINSEQTIIACAKGIDRDTGKTPAELISSISNLKSIGALSGPSFATDVANALPTALTLAFNDMDDARQYAAIMSSESFRIYASDDLRGVELGGALKNVLALAVGAVRGMQLGASAEAALIARGFSELQRLAGAMGARPQTLAGLSGLGDLVLTASSPQSRNFSYGMALGRGDDISDLPLAEGAFSAQIAARLARDMEIDVPIIQAVGNVVSGNLSAQQAVHQLLSRPLKAENE